MSKEDQLLISKMRNILDVATQDIDLSQEMKTILSPYIDFEGSEHNDSFIDEEQIHNDFYIKDQPQLTSLKKLHSANDLNSSTFDNSKEDLLTEENLKRLSNNSSEEKLKFIENILGHHEHQETTGNNLLNKEYHPDLAGNLLNNDEL